MVKHEIGPFLKEKTIEDLEHLREHYSNFLEQFGNKDFPMYRELLHSIKEELKSRNPVKKGKKK